MSPVDATSAPRRHARNQSKPLLRRSTQGPLAVADDPLSTPEPSQSPAQPSPPPPHVSEALSRPSTLSSRPKPTGDVRFLQDPSIYHQIPTDDISPIFLEAEHQPRPEASLATLLQNGHFRRAATAALTELLQLPAHECERIFQLLYTRLACLVLLSRPDLAAQEAVPLTDFLMRGLPQAKDVVPWIPWELRLLLVRLQSIGAADGGRREIMTLYSLTGELRVNIRQAQLEEDQPTLSRLHARLQDLALRVADALVEMGELDTASHHLDSLIDIDQDEVAYRQALIHCRLGHVVKSRRYASQLKNADSKAALDALLKLADGKMTDARNAYRTLVEQHPSEPLYAQNLVVCILYTGQIAEARTLLQDVVQQSPACSSMLFNLSTIYELCSERANDKKTNLMRMMAAKAPSASSGGWERPTFDFKL
ncbi:Hypothetical protein R9X50_00568600 [Acrodontium crateriforme]|uniref:Tetratricopeptide repeat protein 15 n=1 Tax=Acrodontium crateriforme TaxID=150365 RepID=A0AAQ3RDB8_9PEZI|nr:Hypothetical protein R9X50_00568600 [Acrodontium crateriforme]